MPIETLTVTDESLELIERIRQPLRELETVLADSLDNDTLGHSFAGLDEKARRQALTTLAQLGGARTGKLPSRQEGQYKPELYRDLKKYLTDNQTAILKALALAARLQALSSPNALDKMHLSADVLRLADSFKPASQQKLTQSLSQHFDLHYALTMSEMLLSDKALSKRLNKLPKLSTTASTDNQKTLANAVEHIRTHLQFNEQLEPSDELHEAIVVIAQANAHSGYDAAWCQKETELVNGFLEDANLIASLEKSSQHKGLKERFTQIKQEIIKVNSQWLRARINQDLGFSIAPDEMRKFFKAQAQLSQSMTALSRLIGPKLMQPTPIEVKNLDNNELASYRKTELALASETLKEAVSQNLESLKADNYQRVQHLSAVVLSNPDALDPQDPTVAKRPAQALAEPHGALYNELQMLEHNLLTASVKPESLVSVKQTAEIYQAQALRLNAARRQLLSFANRTQIHQQSSLPTQALSDQETERNRLNLVDLIKSDTFKQALNTAFVVTPMVSKILLNESATRNTLNTLTHANYAEKAQVLPEVAALEHFLAELKPSSDAYKYLINKQNERRIKQGGVNYRSLDITNVRALSDDLQALLGEKEPGKNLNHIDWAKAEVREQMLTALEWTTKAMVQEHRVTGRERHFMNLIDLVLGQAEIMKKLAQTFTPPKTTEEVQLKFQGIRSQLLILEERLLQIKVLEDLKGHLDAQTSKTELHLSLDEASASGNHPVYLGESLQQKIDALKSSNLQALQAWDRSLKGKTYDVLDGLVQLVQEKSESGFNARSRFKKEYTLLQFFFDAAQSAGNSIFMHQYFAVKAPLSKTASLVASAPKDQAIEALPARPETKLPKALPPLPARKPKAEDAPSASKPGVAPSGDAPEVVKPLEVAPPSLQDLVARKRGPS